MGSVKRMSKAHVLWLELEKKEIHIRDMYSLLNIKKVV